MRPVPQSRHLVAVLIFAAVAAAEGYFASLDDQLSDAQVNIATAAIKRHQPASFPHDPIFGERQYWRFHTPAFQALLELALVPTNYLDLRLPFRAMAGVVTMIFLCGMYALLYAQCRSWSVSALVAVLSSRVIEAMGGGVWGIGSLESITPTGLCLSVLPLIVLAFSRYARPDPSEKPSARWRILLVFAVVGLMGNFHLVTAMNITIVLMVAYVGMNRWRPGCLPVALAGGACALLAALPYAWYYLSLRAAMSRWEVGPATGSILEALRIGQLTELYPELLKALLDWRMLAAALVLVVPAAAVLGRVERFRTQKLDLWSYLIVGSVFTALGLHGISQLVGRLVHTPPPVIDFLQASGLLMLPLYVLLAQAITNLFRLVRTHRALVRWALAILFVAWMLPSDNCRVVRHAASDLATAFMDEADKPAYVVRHHEQHARRRELEAIARWAERRNGAIFLTDRSEFRALARRPIIAGPNDARYLYYLAPGRLGWWVHRFHRQEELLYPSTGRADGEAIARFAADLIAEDASMKEVAEWYVILRAAVAPTKPGPLTPVEREGWGEQYLLYRVR